MRKQGDRVGCIVSATGQPGKDFVVNFLGYGVYEGDFVPPTGPFGSSWEEYDKIIQEVDISYTTEKRPMNPRIRLDDGRVVWGRDCWFGSEEKIKKTLEGATTIVNV